MEAVSLDVSHLLPIRDEISAAVEAGWTLTNVGPLIRLNGAIGSAPTSWTPFPAASGYAIAARARGGRRGHAVDLQLVNGQWEVSSLPDIAPDQLFDETQLAQAKRLWDHDLSSIDEISLDWSIELDLNLSLYPKPSVDDDPQEVQVGWSTEALDETFRDVTISEIVRYLPPAGHRTYLSLSGNRPEVIFGSVSFATLDGLDDYSVQSRNRPDRLPGELTTSLAPSDVLHSKGPAEAWPDIARALTRIGCSAIWLSVSSGHTESTVEFFGYKRVTFALPSDWPQAREDGALALYRWALGDTSADRLLAIRQIISLYTEPPFDFVEEIVASAETIYLGLRSEATTQAVKDTRDAESQAQQAVRQSSQGAIDLAKSASDRILAGLVAIGVAATANVTRVLDESVTTAILGFVAGYFALMLLLFLIVDRRAVGLSIRQLDADLKGRAGYLTPRAIEAISNSPTVRGAKSLVLTIRIAVAVIYALVVLSLLTVIWVRLGG